MRLIRIITCSFARSSSSSGDAQSVDEIRLSWSENLCKERESHPVNRSPRKKIWQVCCPNDFNQAHSLHHVSIESDRIRFCRSTQSSRGIERGKGKTGDFSSCTILLSPFNEQSIWLFLSDLHRFVCVWSTILNRFSLSTPNDHRAIWLH